MQCHLGERYCHQCPSALPVNVHFNSWLQKVGHTSVYSSSSKVDFYRLLVIFSEQTFRDLIACSTILFPVASDSVGFQGAADRAGVDILSS